MKQRKRIGIVMCECENLIQQRILRGLIAQARTLDCDIAVFSAIPNYDIDTPHQRCAQNIFRLMNPELLDGVIYARQTLRGSGAVREEIDTLLLRNPRLPVVVINEPSEIFPYVMSWERSAFAALTSHFISCHGLRDILCLTGPKGVFTAEERLWGYRDALETHGIPFRQERVVYGDFWTQAAETLGAQLISGEVSMPEAVVCANDPMAVSLCNYLTSHGVAVPEMIAVAGYEASDLGRENLLTVTSYVSGTYALGVEAMCRLYELLSGESCPPPELPRGYLVTRQSCGCGEEREQLAHELRRVQREREYESLFRYSDMPVRLTMTETLDNCMETLANYVYLIRGVEEYYICLCEDWDGSYDIEHPENYRRRGYSDMMRVKFAHGKEAESLRDCCFPAEEMLPSLFSLRDKPSVYYFTPLNHNDRVFGYSVMSFGDAQECYSDVYCRWLANVSTALEFIRVQNYLKTFHNRVYLSSIRDSLTGLYNQEGFSRALEECFDRARRQGMHLLILSASLDNLVQINDSQGHQEGDNAIIRFANAISSSFSGNERCARISGEGFAVVGCGSYDEEAATRYVNAIIGYLEHSSGETTDWKPEASLGYFCGEVPTHSTATELFTLARERMDAHRKSWRTERSAPYYSDFLKLRERIYSTPKGDWAIDVVCREMILSRGYFQKLYTRFFGISFTQDVINSRIYFSKKLLTETELSIAAVATQSGYDNYVHFMHQFKKNVGMTPTDFRNRKRKG